MYQNMNSGVPPVARAIVAANKDPDRLGRVKVTYPWLGGKNSQVPSNWAFVAVPFASKDGGMYVLPEVGDEVLVCFEHGNLDSPIVIGTLYNEKTKPAASGKSDDFNSSGKNTLRYIKTRTGHLMCFDDSEDQGGISLQDKDKRGLSIETKKKIVTISDENGNQVQLTGSQIGLKTKNAAITVESDKVTITAGSAKVSVEGSQVQLGVGGNSVCADNGGVTIQSASQINLGSGATDALIKGTTFLTLFNSHVHTTAVGPSSPPMVPLTPTVLSQKVKTS